MSNVKLGLPSKEVLYDKIIDVELVSSTPNTNIKTVIAMNGSRVDGDEAYRGKALLETGYSTGTQNKLSYYTQEEVESNKDVFGNITMPSSIIIYKGFEHKEYYTDKNGEVHSRTVTASGNTISINIVDEPGKPKYKNQQWWVEKDLQFKINTELNKISEENKKSYGKTTRNPRDYIKQYGKTGASSNGGWSWNYNYPISPGSPFPSPTYQIQGSEIIMNDIQDGVRIIVTNNGVQEKYHAVYLKTDETQTIAHHVTHVTKLSCKKGGLKPSISFTTNVIPGNNCYKTTLKIYNMNLDTINVRDVKTIKITAGYRTQNFQTIFNCAVFSSYIESPNPDGVTVFECLCVGKFSSLVENIPITFHYAGGDISIAEFIESTARGLGEDGVAVYNYLKKEYKELKIGMNKLAVRETYFENGTATLTWMQDIIQRRIAWYEGFDPKKPQTGSSVTYPYVRCSLGQDGALYVYALNRANSDTNGKDEESLLKDLTIVRTVPVLDAVKGATFNGTALTVKSVWNPRIVPHGLFQMKANVFNGANLPNVISDAQIGKSESNMHLYRCITSSVSFSTNGNENEMNVLAVPLIYMDETYAEDHELVQSFQDFVTASLSVYDSRITRSVTYGSPSAQDETTEEEKNAQEIIKNATDSVNKMYTTDLLSIFPVVKLVKCKDAHTEGQSLSEIAQVWFNKTGAPDNQKYCAFDIIPEDTSTIPPNIFTGEPMCPGSRQALWPIIAVLTRNYWEQHNKSSSSTNPYCRVSDPDITSPDRYVVIPVISSFEQLTKSKEIFRYAYFAWSANSDGIRYEKYKTWNGQWYKLYQYLGGVF